MYTVRVRSAARLFASATAVLLFFTIGLIPLQEALAATNLIPNSSLESASGSLPTNWHKGGYGTNTRTLSYPVPGVGASKAVKTEITSYTSGDAKWWFDPVTVSPGVYTYTDQYQSDRTSIVTVQFQRADGSLFYKDIATLPAASSFTPMSADFSVPDGAVKLTIFHLIKGVGFVTVDNASLVFQEGPSGIFTTGAVTLRFDDGWTSQYQNVLPKLNSAGIKGTFYIVTHQLFEDGFTGYMNQDQLRAIFNAGHEIAAHTRTHRDLTTLSFSDQQDEISGSRQDLLSWGFGSVLSFSPPFGAYNNGIISIVQNAGFRSMATSDGQSLNQPTSDRYRLTRFPIHNDTTVASVKQAIDQAAANKEWLIISFHEINTSGHRYSMTPTNFNQVVDYIVAKGIPTVTVSQGAQQLP